MAGASPKSTAATKGEAEEEESSSHVCGVCGRSFPLLSSLSQHMRRHTQEKPYKCPHCEHRTAQKGSLKAHVRSHKLGLLSHASAGTEPDQGAMPHDDSAESACRSSDGSHVANGPAKSQPKKSTTCNGSTERELPGDTAAPGPYPCGLCSQPFPQASLLKAHMKKHRGSQDHGCRICGRRFRQAWFLQSHMRIHRAKAQLRGTPATVNGVVQDPASMANDECLYELCAGCGNFFSDGRTLRVHERLHKRSHGRCQTQNHPGQLLDDNTDPAAAKRRFLESLNLTCVEREEAAVEKSPGRRVRELDPVCSYQAWQLATKGRLAEATEKGLGWEERLADADVAYDRDKGEYIALKQDRKRKPADSCGSAKKKKGSPSLARPPGLSANGGGRAVLKPQSSRVLFNGLGHAFYGALQSNKVKDICRSPKQPNSSSNQDQQDMKAFSCEHCDYHTVDASSLRSHVGMQHHDLMGPTGKQTTILDNLKKSGSKASRYTDYLRNRSALLSQPNWHPSTSAPSQERADSSDKNETLQGPAVKVQGNTAVDSAKLLNLSAIPVEEGDGPANCKKKEGLTRHQCPYCSHTTNYPEVLWIHQRVAHRVEGNSALAPKWAPCQHGFKGSKIGGARWRRTGPPPFLEGKDCPTLLTPRTQRTQPSDYTAPSGSSSKRPAPKSHSRTLTSKSKPSTQSKDPQSSRRTAPLPQKKKSGERKRTVGGASGVTSSSSSTHSGSSSGLQPARSPTPGDHRGAVDGKLLPQEGLGFMLAQGHHGRTSSSHAAADRRHPPSQTHNSSAAPTTHDLWSTMNMWGLHGSRPYLDPLLFAQGKSEATGEMPMNIDIMSLLKNYNPHELAALYQRWGFVDPRLDPQAMFQFNQNFGNEIHSSRDTSKQVNNHSASSSGFLQKGT